MASDWSDARPGWVPPPVAPTDQVSNGGWNFLTTLAVITGFLGILSLPIVRYLHAVLLPLPADDWVGDRVWFNLRGLAICIGWLAVTAGISVGLGIAGGTLSDQRRRAGLYETPSP